MQRKINLAQFLLLGTGEQLVYFLRNDLWVVGEGMIFFVVNVSSFFYSLLGKVWVFLFVKVTALAQSIH